MYKQFQIRKKSKGKPPSQMIRSPAFMKKSQDDIPRINHAAIPLHYTYGLKSQEQLNQMPQQLDDWANIHAHHMIPRRKIKTQSQKKRTSFSPSENLFKKYMSHRQSLIFIKRNLLFYNKVQENYHKTQDKLRYSSMPQKKTVSESTNTPYINYCKLNHTKLSRKTDTSSITCQNRDDQSIENLNHQLNIQDISPDTSKLNQYAYRMNHLKQHMTERRKRKSQCSHYANNKKYQ